MHTLLTFKKRIEYLRLTINLNHEISKNNIFSSLIALTRPFIIIAILTISI